MTDAWRVLGNPTRLKLVDLLQEKSRTTGELCTFFNLSRFAVMQHLKVLAQAGVITAERRGRYRYNHLNHERLATLRAAMASDTAVSTTPFAPTHTILDQHFLLPAAPARIFRALTTNSDQWWREPLPHIAAFTELTNQPLHVHLDPQLGGAWRAHLTSDPESGLLLGTVDQFIQDRRLGLMGSLGMDTAVNLIRFSLTPTADATDLHFRHTLIGQTTAVIQTAFHQTWHTLLSDHLHHFLSHPSA